jgi:hypothetical protein
MTMTLFHKPKSRKSHALLVTEITSCADAVEVEGEWWDLSNSLRPRPLALAPFKDRIPIRYWLDGFDRLLLTVPND